MHGLHDKLEASAEHIVTRIDNAGRDMNIEVDRVEALVHDTAKKTQGIVAEVSGRLDSERKQQDERHEVECGELKEALTRAEDLLVQRLDGLERSCASSLDSQYIAMESKVAGLKQALSKTSEQIRTQVNVATESLASKCHASVQAVDAKISRATARLDTGIASLKEEAGKSARLLQSSVESEDTSIRVHLNTEIQRIREQCLTGFSQINTRVDDELKTMYTKMNLATGKIDTAFHRLDDKFDSALEAAQNKSNQQMVVLDGLISKSNRQSESDLQDLRSLVGAHRQELQHFTKKIEVDQDIHRKSFLGIDAKLAATASKMDSELSRCFKHFTDVCSGIDARLTGNHTTQTAQWHTQQAHFTDEIGALGRRMYLMDSKFTSSVEKLRSTVKAHQSDIDGWSEELRHAIDDFTTEQAARLSKIEGSHADRYRQFQRKTTDKFALLDANVNMQKDLFADSYTHLDANLTKAVAELRNLIAKNEIVAKLSSSRIEQDVRSKCDEVRDSMLRIKQVQSSAIRALDDQASKHRGKIEDVHGSVLKLQQDAKAMAEQNSGEQKRIMATIQQLDQKCAAQGQDLAADILDTRQMLSDNTAHLIAEVTALRSGNASRLDELSHTVEANSRHCVDMYSKLDQTTVEYHQHFTNVCAAIDAKHGEKLAAMEVREQNRHQQVTEVHQSAVKLFEDKNLALSTETQAQTKRISELQRLLEKQRQDSRGMCDSIEKKLIAADSAQDSRLDDMRDAIEANHRHFTEVAKTLNSKFSEENAACTRRITDEINSISKRCSDNKLVHQQDAAKHHQIVMGVCEVLRRDIDVSSHDLQGKFAELSQRIAGSESEVKSMCSSLDTTWRQQLATQQAETKKLSDHIVRDHELLVNSSRNFEISTANKFQQAETQLRELRSEMQTSNLALGTANDKIEADLLFQKQSHEQNLELHTHYIEETSNSLDQMFSHQVSVFQAQLEEQLHLCEDACTKVERRCVEANAEQVSRADKTDELIQMLSTQLARAVSESEERVASDISIQKLTLDKLKNQLDVAWCSMDNNWTKMLSEHDARVEAAMDRVRGMDDQLNSTCSDLEARIVVEIAAQAEWMKTQIEELRTNCRAIEHTVEQESAERRAHVADLGNETCKKQDHLTSDIASMQLTFTKKNSLQDAGVKDMKSHFAALVAELDKRFTDAEQDARLDRMDVTIRQHFEQFMDQHRQVQDQISSANAENCELSRNHYNQFLDVARDLNHKMSAERSQQDERVDKLVSSVDEHHRVAAALVSQLDAKVSSENGAQDERIAALHEHFTAVCDDLAKRFRFGEIETRMDHISSTISENHQHFTTGATSSIFSLLLSAYSSASVQPSTVILKLLCRHQSVLMQM